MATKKTPKKGGYIASGINDMYGHETQEAALDDAYTDSDDVIVYELVEVARFTRGWKPA